MVRFIAFCWLLLSIVTSNAFADGAKVRTLMKDLALACAQADAPARIAQLKEALTRNREAIIYVLRHPNFDALPSEVGWSAPIGLSEMERAALSWLSSMREMRELFVAEVIEQDAGFFERAGDVEVGAFGNYIRDMAGNQRLSDHQAFKLLLDPESGLSSDNGTTKLLFEKYLPRYIDALTVEEKLRTAAEVLALPPDASPINKIRVAVLTANVFIQKILQLLAKEFKSPDLVQAILEVQSNVKPFPWEKMRPVFAEAMGADFARVVRHTYLASGTIGQVYLFELDTGEKLIAKGRRPGVMESIDRDEKTFLKVIDDESIKDAFRKMAKKIREEADFTREAINTKKGELYINRKLHIDIAKLHPDFKSTGQVLFLRLATGRNLSKIDYGTMSVEQLNNLANSIETLLRMWFRRSLYGDGFFHGDAHPGNLFYDESITEDTAYLLTVIDFGNASNLELVERQTFTKLAAAIFFGREDAVNLALKQITEVKSFNETEAQSVIHRAMTSQGTTAQKINEIFETLALRGFQFSDNLLMYNRGRLFLENELVTIQQRLRAKGHERSVDFTTIYVRESLNAVLRSFPWPNSSIRSLLGSGVAGVCSFLARKVESLFYSSSVPSRVIQP